MSDISRVTVLGAGVLGGQIAWHSAFKGKTVVVYDVAADAIARAQTTHRTYAGDLPWLVPLLNAAQTLVTNGVAAPEDIDRTFMVNEARCGPMGR